MVAALTPTSPSILADDPHWWPCRIDTNLGRLGFIRVTQQQLVESPFLDGRHLADQPQAWMDLTKVDLPAMADRLRSRHPPAGFIFHGAFCGSTLLAQALTRPGVALVLKEPDILRQGLEAPAPGHRAAVLDLLLALLARRFSPREAVIIKPTNLANGWLHSVIASGAPVLLTHPDLSDFLVSILMRGETGRVFARQILARLVADGAPVAAIAPARAMLLTDLQVAALAWRQQMEIFADAADRAPTVRTLQGKTFALNRLGTLRAASAHFQLHACDDAIAETADAPLFRRNAKSPRESFHPQAHDQRRAAIAETFGEALAETAAWVAGLRLGRELSLPLARGLVAA